MLSIVPQSQPIDRLEEARELLRIVESWRPNLRTLVDLLLLPLVGVGLVANGLEWGGLLIGSSVSLAFCRYGPRRWPGKR